MSWWTLKKDFPQSSAHYGGLHIPCVCDPVCGDMAIGTDASV
jgi:hypothetical protein